MVESLLFIGAGADEKKTEPEPVENGPTAQHCSGVSRQ